MTGVTLTAAAIAIVTAGATSAAQQQEPVEAVEVDGAVVGYDGTPQIPGTEWHVHDPHRPLPAVVAPGDAVGAPPADAIVLFNGSDLSEWTMAGAEEPTPANWRIEDEILEVPGYGDGQGSIMTKQTFGDIQLHVEFRTPNEPEGDKAQNRGNSGIFLMGLYEVQVLDSYQSRTYADGQAAALYGYKPPMVNAARSPQDWQVYDILFEAPRWDEDGDQTKKATVTVIHNGVAVHHAEEMPGPSSHQQLASKERHAQTGPLQLQNHGDAVQFRNIWVRPLEEKTQG